MGDVGQLVGLPSLPGHSGHRAAQVGPLGRQVLALARPHLSGWRAGAQRAAREQRAAKARRRGATGSGGMVTFARTALPPAAQACHGFVPKHANAHVIAQFGPDCGMGDLGIGMWRDHSAQRPRWAAVSPDASPRLSCRLRVSQFNSYTTTPLCTSGKPPKRLLPQLSNCAPSSSASASRSLSQCTVKSYSCFELGPERRATAAAAPPHLLCATRHLRDLPPLDKLAGLLSIARRPNAPPSDHDGLRVRRRRRQALAAAALQRARQPHPRCVAVKPDCSVALTF